MESVIDDLFYGKIHPWERETAVENTDVLEMESRLKESLDDEQKKLFDEITAKQGSMRDSFRRECYREGVIFGIRLMTEVFGVQDKES